MPAKKSPPNILEDLLGVKADQAAPAIANQELDALTRITHRGRRRPDQESTGPVPEPQTPSAERPLHTAPPARGPAAGPLAPPPQPDHRPAPETPPAPKGASLLALLTVIRINTKNFQVEIQMPDRQPCTCAFQHGQLADEYFIAPPAGLAVGERAVLVVDADQAFGLATARGLAEYESRFRILLATTGKQAVRLLETRKIDLLITGLKLPEMDGFELLAHMQAQFPSVPTLAVSTFNFAAMHARVKQLGARRHLIKPVEPAELAALIIEILGRGSRGKSIKGITFTDFVTQLGLNTASCFVDISLPGKDRCLCRVEQGFIQSISRGSTTGETALRELLSWDRFRITFCQAPI